MEDPTSTLQPSELRAADDVTVAKAAAAGDEDAGRILERRLRFEVQWSGEFKSGPETGWREPRPSSAPNWHPRV